MNTILTGAIFTGNSLTSCLTGASHPAEHHISDKNSPVRKPNIVFIMTDQHNAQFLGCLGRPELRTPNFDALAKQSVIFTSAYSASPVSGPSRAAVFTGMYPLHNGVTKNWIQLKNESGLLTERLAKAGYLNAMIGKLHLTPVSSSHGFHYSRICDSPYDLYDKKEVETNDYLKWAAEDMGIKPEQLAALAGESERYDTKDPRFWLGWSWTDDAHQITTWTGNEAVSFINNYEKKQPFFIHISFFGPHHPYSTCAPWDEMYDPAKVTLPPTFDQIQPGAQSGIRNDWTEEKWREIIARYSGNISAIDFQIERIVKALKEQGLWENTLIVFTSDHGDHMGDFSQLGKGTMLESSVRVPFFIKPPGATPTRRECSAVINLLDLYNTFLEYAGVSDTVTAPDSRSIRRLLNRPAEWINQTFSSLCTPDARNGQVMYIKDKYKCVGFLKDGKMDVELYNRTEKVPDMINLAGKSEYASVVGEMKSALEVWLDSFRKK